MKKIFMAPVLIWPGSFSSFSQVNEVTAYFTVSWSPDGKYPAFTRSELKMGPPRSMKADIYLMKADGTGVIKITGEDKNELDPSWSRDGNRISFMDVNPAVKESDIYIMSKDGTDVQRLTTDSNVAFYNPQWSPDGKKLVYYAEKGDHKDQIWTMNADGSNQTLLTRARQEIIDKMSGLRGGMRDE